MKNKLDVIPAVIAKTQEELDGILEKVNDHAEIIQLDIMDNKFVPNTSLFFDFTLPKSQCKYEAHLMVSEPKEWLEKHIDKIDTILVHHESNYEPREIIKYVKKQGKKMGLVLNPETPISEIKEYLDDIDQVLIMTVTPGFYGSPFLEEMMEKITELRSLKQDLDIEVDGGITDKTIRLTHDAGANMFVSGSYIVKSDDVRQAMDSLMDLIQ